MAGNSEMAIPEAEPNTRTSNLLMAGTIGALLLFGGLGGWLYFANVAGAVIGQGVVVVQGKPKTLQHLDGGIVTQINVTNGDFVEMGTLLVKLDDTLLRSNLEIYNNRLRETTARQARLLAERDGEVTILWSDKILNLLGVSVDEQIRAGQKKLFDVRKTTRTGQKELLEKKIAQFLSQKIGVNALKKSKDSQIALLEEELGGVRILKEKGLAPTTKLLALERQKEDLVGRNAEHDAELARINNSISETEIQILQVEREFQQSVLTELREIDQEVNDVSQQLHATSEKLKRVEIKAPVAGIIHELAVATIGGVVSPGSAILQVIPQDDKFEIEVNIEPQFIDELTAGQHTVLRFTTFNQRTTPEIDGAVKNISPNSVINPQTGIPFYKVMVEVAPLELTKLNGQKLVPGMPVEAFIQTKQRSPLSYLAKPLLDQMRHVGREE
ncbi:MAG: HlyD family type I secretion periplasmic adaptor subunit [Rhizobiaceae bacterium]